MINLYKLTRILNGCSSVEPRFDYLNVKQMVPFLYFLDKWCDCSSFSANSALKAGNDASHPQIRRYFG